MGSCPKSLGADLPASLKPNIQADPFSCLTRDQKERIQIAIEENQSCHSQLASTSSRTDWVGIALIGIGALTVGYVVGQTSK